MKVKRYRFRLIILLVLMTTGLGFLISRLNKLQIEQQDSWKENVPGAKEETIRIPAIRGDIRDRNGIILASNKQNYEIDINLEEVYRFYKDTWQPLEAEKDSENRSQSMNDIADIANMTIIPRLKRFGVDRKVSKNSLRVHYSTHKGLIGYNYSDNLTFDQFCTLSENTDSIPGAHVSVRPRRVYPHGALAGHVLGNTKLWKRGNIPEHEVNRYDHYQGDSYGDCGVEFTMDKYLKGVPGQRTITRGPKQVFLGVKDENPPSNGADVDLTIDAGLQTHIEHLLRNVGRGGITVLDVQTGEILAMATVPTMNPNDYIPRISQKKFNYYNNNPASPFLNNAIQQHQPGSVFKIPVALAAAQANFIGYSHNCIGYESYGRTGNLKIRCWNTDGHGTLGMSNALMRSCNPYFMALANKIGGTQVVDMFSLLGLGKKSGIAVTGEESGIVPGSLQWKRNIAPGKTLTPATLSQLSIGQSQSSASTLQIAAVTAAVANNGKFMKPRIIKSVTHPEKGILKEDTPTMRVDLTQEGISEGSLQIIRKGMWQAVNSKGGTAGRVKFSDTIEAAGKTGTAQTIEFGKKSNNAWTTAFAPYDSPRYAVCAVVLGGKSGGAVAGPLVRETFKALFSEESLPVETMENYAGHINEIEELILESTETQ